MQAVKHVNSYYAASVASRLRDYPALQGDVDADVCVIGGGFAGMSSALHLAQKGLKVVLLEQNRVAWGASGRNGGHMESLFAHDPDDFTKIIGEERVAGMWALSTEASNLVKDIIDRNQIDCDVQYGIGHVGYTEAHAKHLMEGAEKFVARGYRKNVVSYSRKELADVISTEKYHGGFFDMDMIHLNPLRFAVGFAEVVAKAGVRICENTVAQSYDPNGTKVKVKTPNGTVVANNLVLATNANVHRIEPKLAQDLFNVSAWVIATEPLGEERAAALIKNHLAVNDSRMFIDFYRISYDRRLVFGSVAPIRLNNEAKIKRVLGQRMLDVYPQLKDLKIDYAWGCKGSGTIKFLPHIGRFKPNVYYSLASNVAWAVLNGKLLSEAITGNNDRFGLVEGIEVSSFPIGVRTRELIGMAYKLYERMTV